MIMTFLSTSTLFLALYFPCTDAVSERSALRPISSSSSAAAASSGAQFENNNNNRILQEARTDLVRLIPFDVQIALSFEETSELEGINLVGLTDIITDWISESFRVKSTSELLEEEDQADSANGTEVTTTLNSVALELAKQRIQTTTVSSSSRPLALLTTSYAGISLWDRTGTKVSMDPDLVELMQRATFLEDNALLNMLLAADTSVTGFPSQDGVIDVRAYITPLGGSGNTNDSPTKAPSGGNKNLEIVIIIAIVVACLAFGLLIFAVIWAWKSDNTTKSTTGRSRASSRKSASAAAAAAAPPQKSSNKTSGSTTKQKKGFMARRKENKKERESKPDQTSPPPPTTTANAKDQLQGSALAFGDSSATGAGPSSNAGTGAGATINDDPYPESVVSGDISTSLTAYYNTGMHGSSNAGSNKGMLMKNHFDDGASMSSMDSYGYSLDGYAPSLGTAQGGYPVGPLQAAKDAKITVGDEDDDVIAADDEEVEDYESQP